jgi:hypothetical protein
MSFLPCCVQTLPLRVNSWTQGKKLVGSGAAESATDIPWPSGNGCSPAPLPRSLLPCCVQASPLRVNTHAAPVVR